MIGRVFERVEVIKTNATKSELVLIEKLQKMDINELIYMSITELAAIVGMGEATILRFCRKLGYKGFQDFKLNLSQDLVTGNNSSSDDIAKNVLDRMCDALTQTQEKIDLALCQEVAKKIINARKVCFFGVGNSNIAAQSAKARLIKVGINIECASDSHVQTVICSNLDERDIVVLISVSGSTKDIIVLSELAKKNNTPVVVLTNYDRSPLAKNADYIFVSSKKEAPYEGGTLATVVSQIYLVDMISVCVFDIIGHSAVEKSVEASKSVSDKSI